MSMVRFSCSSDVFQTCQKQFCRWLNNTAGLSRGIWLDSFQDLWPVLRHWVCGREVGALTMVPARFRCMSREGIGNSPSVPLAIYGGAGGGGGNHCLGRLPCPVNGPLVSHSIPGVVPTRDWWSAALWPEGLLLTWALAASPAPPHSLLLSHWHASICFKGNTRRARVCGGGGGGGGRKSRSWSSRFLAVG